MKADNLIGYQYGKLTVLERDFNYVFEHNIKTKRSYWKCRCECGKIITVRGSHLKDGTTQSCGCLTKEIKIPNLTNKKFGKLLVLEYVQDQTKWKKDRHI